MLEIISHDDVTELRFSSWRSRSMRYAVSAFATRGVLVDTAFPNATSDLVAWLDQHEVRGAIVTHGHLDHSGNVALLAARGIPIQVAASTEQLLRHPGRLRFHTRYVWGRQRPLTASFASFSDPQLHLRKARGHSADHHVVWDAERGTVFGGDLFVSVKVRLVHHDEDVRTQVRVLREVASWHPERFFDAHRGRVHDPVTLLRAKADWMEETIGRIEERLRQGWADAAIRDAVLGREGVTAIASAGDYSHLNFVRNVRATMPST